MIVDGAGGTDFHLDADHVSGKKVRLEMPRSSPTATSSGTSVTE
jgi:hypothetical protein